MKKSLIILALALTQAACSTQLAVPGGGKSLLSFEAISAEITVSYVETEPAPELSQTLALNSQD